MFTDDITLASQSELPIDSMTYRQVDIAELDMTGLEFRFVTFSKCRFVDCDFSGASFYDVKMENCDFSNCRFYSCYFKNTMLTDCKGDGCNFSQGSFIASVIEKGSYYYANFAETLWERSAIANGILQHSSLSGVKFKKTTFQNVNLTDTDFFKTPLKGIDLSSCVIDGIVVSDHYTELRGAKINAAQAVTVASLLGVKIV